MSPGRRTLSFDRRTLRATTIDELVAGILAIRPGRPGELAASFARTALQRVPGGIMGAADREVMIEWLLDAYDFVVEGSEDDDSLRLRLRTPDQGADGREGTTIIDVAGLDRPFIVSTLTATLRALGHSIVRTVHPIVGIERDANGEVVALLPARDATEPRTLVQFHLDHRLDDDELTVADGQLRTALDDIVRVTDDHSALQRRVRELADRVADTVSHDGDDPAEVAAFLHWLLDGNVVLLGWRDYLISQDEDPATVQIAAGSGLGILRDDDTSRFVRSVPLDELEEEYRRRFTEGRRLRVSRTNRESTVHRLARMDYIGIVEHDVDGRPIVEHRLLALFTARAFAAPTSGIPVLRRRLDQLRSDLDMVPGSHDDTLFTTLFEALPTDELFQSDPADLRDTLVALAEAEEHHRVRVVTRIDAFTSTVSTILAVPRDNWSASLRLDVEGILARAWDAQRVAVDVAVGDRTETVARFVVDVPGDIEATDPAGVERQIRERARNWDDRARDRLIEEFGEAEGHRRTRGWALRVPESYREQAGLDDLTVDVAALDEHEWSSGDPAVWLRESEPDDLHLLVAQAGPELVLSDLIPVVESLGLRVLRQVPHAITSLKPPITIHDLVVTPGTVDVKIHPQVDGVRIAATVVAARAGRCEVDALHHLVVTAGLSWREVAVLRAYRRYRRQVGTAYSTATLNEALIENATAARALMAVFHHRFDPDLADRDEDAAVQAVLTSCDAIVRLDHDRIVRDMLALVRATLRTNAYRNDGLAENAAGLAIPYLVLKFDSSAVPGLPAPVPYREIFVHSPEVEGIHLRGGPIARGGLRWSDRKDDTRTEVLGLMQAQMLKNAVIVPEGAKGGFVLGRPPADPHERRDEVRRQYTTFIRALLDVTDTVRDEQIIPPDRVRRHDGDDPYLVVAADKGTATFSDVANGIALSRGFWLGDAFASGGSVGYDHKKLGITARGAWVATARHFTELGVDLQADPVTVVGVGDMSGDVFGNGMLLSQSLRLIAAFDHRDIFLDPDPDAAGSHTERQRLFDLPSSSWQNYDQTLLSPGGMIVPRTAKQVDVTAQVAASLGIEPASMSPTDLMRHILAARVDLLYFGGIGTYVRGPDETDEAIGDRANDDIRVAADEVRARVVTEGANLAVTPRGRIAYARRGGRIDQDAIHNAAGVDISDHEVNVKILLDLAVSDGRINPEERAEWLRRVTDDVVTHVLEDVDRQCARLSRDALTAPARLDAWEQTVALLESGGWIDRAVHHLPDEDEFDSRAQAGAGLTRPELATVLASTKRWLTTVVLDEGLAADPGFADVLDDYFPRDLRETFGDLVPRHRLRDELVATLVANHIVNRFGPTHVCDLARETGHSPGAVIAATWAASLVISDRDWWSAARSTESWLPLERVDALLEPLDALVRGLVRHYLDDPLLEDVAAIGARDQDVFDTLRAAIAELGSDRQRTARLQRITRLVDDLVADDLATMVASAPELAMAADVAALQRSVGQGQVVAIGAAMLKTDDRLYLEDLRNGLAALVPNSSWEVRQRSGLTADLGRLRRDAVAAALQATPDLVPADAVSARFPAGHRRLRVLADVVRDALANQPSLDALAVAVRAAQDLLRPI